MQEAKDNTIKAKITADFVLPHDQWSQSVVFLAYIRAPIRKKWLQAT